MVSEKECMLTEQKFKIGGEDCTINDVKVLTYFGQFYVHGVNPVKSECSIYELNEKYYISTGPWNGKAKIGRLGGKPPSHFCEVKKIEDNEFTAVF